MIFRFMKGSNCYGDYDLFIPYGLYCYLRVIFFMNASADHFCDFLRNLSCLPKSIHPTQFV